MAQASKVKKRASDCTTLGYSTTYNVPVGNGVGVWIGVSVGPGVSDPIGNGVGVGNPGIDGAGMGLALPGAVGATIEIGERFGAGVPIPPEPPTPPPPPVLQAATASKRIRVAPNASFIHNGFPRRQNLKQRHQAEHLKASNRMARKGTKTGRSRLRLDDPKGARRNADVLVGTERLEAAQRAKNVKYKAELENKSWRPKR